MTRWIQSCCAWCVLGLSLATFVGCEPGAKPAGDAGATKTTDGASKGKKRIVFLTNSPALFWEACREGLKAGEKQFNCAESGLSVVMEVNSVGGDKGQIDKLRQFASQPDIAAVAISVVTADNVAIVEEMKKLQGKGVKVIAVDGDVNRVTFPDARPYYIGTDNNVGGEVLGQVAKRLLEAKKVESGGYVQFAGYTNNDNARSRMNGFKKAVGDAYQEIDRMPDSTDRKKARDNVRNALTNHPDKLVSLVGIWAYNAPAIAEVVTERNLRDKFVITTFDAEPEAIKFMDEGKIDAMVVQNPFDMGVQAVRLLKAMIEKDEAVIKEMFPNPSGPNGDVYTTGLRVIAPDNSDVLKADQFDSKVVEFMTVSQLKEWLAKYNLTKSGT